MSNLNDAVEAIVMHKADKMKNSKEYENYIKSVLNDHHIEAVEVFKMGAVDAMIYDVGSALGFTRQTSSVDDWTSRRKRKEMLKKIFPKGI